MQPRGWQLADVRLFVGHGRIVHVTTDNQHRTLYLVQPLADAPADEGVGGRFVSFGVVFPHLLHKQFLVLGLMRLREEATTDKLAYFIHRGEVEHQPPLKYLPMLPPIGSH